MNRNLKSATAALSSAVSGPTVEPGPATGLRSAAPCTCPSTNGCYQHGPQPREHGVPCSRCSRPTFAVAALCETCAALPPDSRLPERWLDWLADSPHLIDAIDTAIRADMHYGIICYAVGKWIADQRHDELAERIHAAFLHAEKVLAR